MLFPEAVCCTRAIVDLISDWLRHWLGMIVFLVRPSTGKYGLEVFFSLPRAWPNETQTNTNKTSLFTFTSTHVCFGVTVQAQTRTSWLPMLDPRVVSLIDSFAVSFQQRCCHTYDRHPTVSSLTYRGTASSLFTRGPNEELHQDYWHAALTRNYVKLIYTRP